MKIDDVRDVLTEPNYGYYLHGTGYGDNEHQENVIKSIFQKGLRASHNAMYWTTVSYGSGVEVEKNWDKMVYDMNHWLHKNSKNIIIVRFPIKYLIRGADESLGENDYAIYNEVIDHETEQVTRFINPKMVVGCYNVTSGEFMVNPNFEKDLSPETENELKKKYEEGVSAFQERKKEAYKGISLFGASKTNNSTNVPIVEDPSLAGPLTMDDTERLFD